MATQALRKLKVGGPSPHAAGVGSPAPKRLHERLTRREASTSLFKWLQSGGPVPVRTPRRADAPPLVHLSDAFEICGTDDNISLIAKRPVEKMHFIVGVAVEPRPAPTSEPISPASRRSGRGLVRRGRRERCRGAYGEFAPSQRSPREFREMTRRVRTSLLNNEQQSRGSFER